MANQELVDIAEDTDPDPTDVVYAVNSTGTTDKRVEFGNIPISGGQISSGTVADERIASSIARDSEVSSAVSSHAAAVDPHGDRAFASAAVDTHDADTSNVHGIPDTSVLETSTGAQAKADAKVSDVAYDALSWNGVTGTAPSKNAVRDQVELLALLAGRSGGQSLAGGTGGSDALTLRGDTSSAHAGSIIASSPLYLYDSDETFTADPGHLVNMRKTYTLDFSSSKFGGSGGIIAFAPTFKHAQSGSAIPVQIFANASTYTNSNAVTANLGGSRTIASDVIYQADGATITAGPIADFDSKMTFQRINSGVLTGSSDTVNFQAALVVGAGCTVDPYNAFVVKAPTGSGAVTNFIAYQVRAGGSPSANMTGLHIEALTGTTANVGIEIDQPSGGSVENIGIRNGGTTVWTPELKAITATSDTIPVTASLIRLNNTSGSSKTLASTPTMATGNTGQIITLLNTSANEVVLQDQATLGSSNLRLGAPTRSLFTRDTISLIYHANIGDWVELTWNGNGVYGRVRSDSATISTGVALEGASTGAGTITTMIGLRITDLAVGSTKWGMQVGDYQSYHEGDLRIGATAGASTTAPNAKLEVIDTVDADVLRLVGVATNDDTLLRYRPARFTSTDGTANQTAQTIALSNSQTVMVITRVLARRTGGSSGSTDDGAAYWLAATFKCTTGTAAQIGSTASLLNNESQSTWDCNFATSGANVLVRVTGATNNNVTWHVHTEIIPVGS